VRFTTRVGAAVVAVTVALVVTAAFPIASQSTEGSSVRILFDLGDGTYLWSVMSVPDFTAPNASWAATLEGAAQHGLPIEWGWFDCCGVAVFDVGNRDPPAGFVGLYLWNATVGAWEFAPTGISGLVLRPGDSIAWYNAAFDGVTFEGRFPVPSPDDPSPAVAFRGNAANRAASLSEAPNGNQVLWDRNLGVPEIGSTPAVAFGRIYVTTLDGLFALDADSGQVLWTNPDVRGFSSPAVFDGSVVVGSSDGRVYRVAASDGTERWNSTLLSETTFSGITSSPKVWFDWAFVGTFNESGGPGEVVGLWASNGTVAWRHATQSVHFSSPAIVDGTLYIGITGRYNRATQITFDPPYGVLALDARTGTETWFFPTGGPVAASPVVDGPRVLAPAKDGVVYAIDRATGEEVWRMGVGAGVSSPAVADGRLFVGGGAFDAPGRVVAMNSTTGDVEWSFEPNGPVQASVTYGDGKVFFSTNTAIGTIYALNATTGRIVWSLVPSPAQYILGSPVLANGILYAPSDNGHLYAIPVSTLPLADLETLTPSEIRAGEVFEIGFTLRALNGTLTEPRVVVRVPMEFDILDSTPGPTSRDGQTVIWEFRRIPFGESRSVTLRALALANESIHTDHFFSVAFAADDGTPYGPFESHATITIISETEGGPVGFAGPWIWVVAAVLAIAIAVSALVLSRRRRGA